MTHTRRTFAAAVVAALCFGAPQVFAQNVSPPLADKSFAEHRLILQLSDRDPAKEALVLSVAYNLVKYYGPDKIAIEVVAFGPGIDLLLTNSPNRAKVDSLISQGVVFDICMNTVDTVERETGKSSSSIPRRCMSWRASRRFSSSPKRATRPCVRSADDPAETHSGLRLNAGS